MTVFIKETTTPSLAIDFVEERIKLIKKETSYTPEYLNICNYQINS